MPTRTGSRALRVLALTWSAPDRAPLPHCLRAHRLSNGLSAESRRNTNQRPRRSRGDAATHDRRNPGPRPHAAAQARRSHVARPIFVVLERGAARRVAIDLECADLILHGDVLHSNALDRPYGTARADGSFCTRRPMVAPRASSNRPSARVCEMEEPNGSLRRARGCRRTLNAARGSTPA